VLRVTTSTVSEVREYFATELRNVLAKRKVRADQSFDYLVDLLVRYMRSENFFDQTPDGKLQENVLAHLYAKYLEGDAETRHFALKRLGDICLLITGVFPESLRRKIVGVNYYFGMGGAAYSTLSDLQFSQIARTLFSELSAKFKDYSNVLSELSAAHGLQKNSDLLHLYERWLTTGDDRLKARLAEKGIVQADAKIFKITQ
jgi:hypothetical protein